MCWLLLIFYLSVFAIGQSEKTQKVNIIWKKLFGGTQREIGWSCLKTNDNGFVVGGLTRSFGAGEVDAYIIKTDHRGKEQWSKTVGGTKADLVVSIKLTSDNGFIAGGYTTSYCSGRRSFYLIRLDSRGNVKWEKSYCSKGDDRGLCVIANKSKEFLICGDRTISDTKSNDVLLLKTDDEGILLWERTFGGKDLEVGTNVIQTQDNGYVIGGHTQSLDSGNEDILLIKTDSKGNQVWRKTFGGPGKEFIHGTSGLIQSSDGGLVICGVTNSFGKGKDDYYIIKTSRQGETLWQTYFGGINDDHPLSIIEVEDGDFLIAGYTKSFGSSDRNSHILRIDSQGKEKWSALLGGPEFNCALCLQAVNKDEYVICGETVNNSKGERDAYLMKIRK
jgi:hypothetical protein